jgi:dihydropteroate synthase
MQAGIDRAQIVIDPGFGFGKNLEHNYYMLANLEYFHPMGVPILAGMSRKSMLGQLLERDVNERLAGSIAVAMVAAQKGAQIIRVHDVKETVDAVKVVSKLNAYRNNNSGR